MNLGEKIGAGLYRDCFEIQGNPDLCAKVQRAKVVREIPEFGISVDVKMEIFLLLKFGGIDLNAMEYRTFESMPDCLRSYTPEVKSLHMDDKVSNRSRLVMSRPRDFDGQYSSTVSEHGIIYNDDFWRQVDEIAKDMLAYDLFSTDIFYLGQNILVQKVTPTTYKPILIDVKHIGRATFHIRKPRMILKNERIKMFLRNLEEFKRNFYRPEHLQERFAA